MKNEEVFALLETFPDLFDDEDLVEELAADLHPLSESPVLGEPPTVVDRETGSSSDPFGRRWDSKPARLN